MSFVKHARPGTQSEALRLEALGLDWLRAAEISGGAHVAEVFQVGAGWLELERIASTTPTRPAAEAFGHALALTHAAGAEWFGQAPPGWTGGEGTIGLAPLSFTQAQANPDWGTFYADKRIQPFIDLAIQRGNLDSAVRKDFARVRSRLIAGDFTSPQPELVALHGSGVARIHGDLWAGNVLWNPPSDGNAEHPWTGAVLIDPAAQGGHAETDLAMLHLFGAPYLDRIIAAYNETSPLAEGWRARIGLHQLHPLAVHAALFGSGYAPEFATLLKRYT